MQNITFGFKRSKMTFGFEFNSVEQCVVKKLTKIKKGVRVIELIDILIGSKYNLAPNLLQFSIHKDTRTIMFYENLYTIFKFEFVLNLDFLFILNIQKVFSTRHSKKREHISWNKKLYEIDEERDIRN